MTVKDNGLFDFIVTPKKIFLVDYSIFVHRAIFAWRNQKGSLPAAYFCLNSILSSLNLLKASKDDVVILAIDSYGKGNWRRDYDPAYKANRKDARDSESGIDWAKEFSEMNKLLLNLYYSTHFIPVQIDRLEADDIISYVCRHYPDYAKIILTTDSDMNQLYYFDNVKIFSPANKKIREVKYPLRELTKKIEKEKTDNLITPITNELEYEKRRIIVSLISLPKEIDDSLKKVFDTIDFNKTNYNPNKLKYIKLLNKYQKIKGVK